MWALQKFIIVDYSRKINKQPNGMRGGGGGGGGGGRGGVEDMEFLEVLKK